MPGNRKRVAPCQPVDIVVQGHCPLDVPYFADVKGVFIGPGGSYTIPGFYDGNDTWKVRFSPTAVGTWSYAIVSPHVHAETSSG